MEKYCEMLDYLGKASLKEQPENYANLFLFHVIFGEYKFEAILFAHQLDNFVSINEELKDKISTEEVKTLILSNYKLEDLVKYENK